MDSNGLKVADEGQADGNELVALPDTGVAQLWALAEAGSVVEKGAVHEPHAALAVAGGSVVSAEVRALVMVAADARELVGDWVVEEELA